jgi:hypothetical protein
MPKKGDRAIARAAIFEVVDNQLRAGDPPETRRTLERLMEEGRSRQEARRLIALVVICEINDMVREGRAFDEARFVAALQRLPEPPWGEESDH